MDLTYYDKIILAQFTSLEKQAMYQLLCGAMIVDGNRDSREIALINEVNQIMNFTVAEQQASRTLSRDTANRILRGMDNIKKAYVAKFMAQVIIADGVITNKEEQFFFYIKDVLQLPDVD